MGGGVREVRAQRGGARAASSRTIFSASMDTTSAQVVLLVAYSVAVPLDGVRTNKAWCGVTTRSAPSGSSSSSAPCAKVLSGISGPRRTCATEASVPQPSMASRKLITWSTVVPGFMEKG